MTESITSAIQLVLGIIAVGGIGGVWFRLGTLTEKQAGLERRVSKIEDIKWVQS